MRQTISNMMAQAENNAEVQLRQMERIKKLEAEVKYLKWCLEIVIKLGNAIHDIPGQKRSPEGDK